MSAPMPRLEEHLRMFHAGCGGIVIGPLDDLVCAECHAQMTAFITDEERQIHDAAREAGQAAARAIAEAKGIRICKLCGAPITGGFQLDKDGRASHIQLGSGCPPQNGGAQ